MTKTTVNDSWQLWSLLGLEDVDAPQGSAGSFTSVRSFMGPLPSPPLPTPPLRALPAHLTCLRFNMDVIYFEHLIGWNRQSGLWCLTWARSGSGPQLLLKLSNVWTF